MSSVTRIRWRLARAVLWGGVFGVVLTVASLLASSALPWERIIRASGGLAAASPGSPLTRDGWTLTALAAVALVVGGLVQGVIHEWRLRRLVVGPGVGGAEDPRAGRAATLRSLPLVSAAASLVSWTVGGTSLAVLSTALLDLATSQAAEIAVVCIAVGAMLAPFRYYRVRREIPGFWDLLAIPATAPGTAARGGRAVLSLPFKLGLGVTLPLAGLVLTVAASTAHRRDLAGDEAARARLDGTAQLVVWLIDSALRGAAGGADVAKATDEVFSVLERTSSRSEVALLDRARGRIAGRASFFDPARVVAALERGEPLERIPGVVLGAARVERIDGWLVVAEPARRASAWTAIFEPRLAWLVVLGLGGTLALTWLIARDLRAGLEAVRAHLDALEPGVTSLVARPGERFGDDEIVALEEQVVELAARVRRARLRRERRRAEFDDLAVRVAGRWREASEALAHEVELAIRVRRAAEGLVEVVGNVELIWGQLARELARQDQMNAAAATSIDGSVEACDRLAGESADIAARVGRLVAAIGPLFDDVHALRATAEVTAGSAGAAADLNRAFAQQCRSVADACTRVLPLSHGVEAAIVAGAEGADRVRVAVGDVGQSVHRVEEGVALLREGFRVLEEVADRSALLAVNAAIVAARSSSAGGGFTIVADEMRDLAQRAADGVHEAVQVASAVGRDVRGAVLAVEAVWVRLDQMAQGARGMRGSIQSLTAAAAAAQDEASRAEDVAGQAHAEVVRTRQLADQVVSGGQRMAMTRASLETQIEGGESLELLLRQLVNDLGSGVRGSVAQTREAVQAMRRPGEVVERLDALARELGQGVQVLGSDLRELAAAALRAQDLARLLLDDVGAALRDRVEPS